jgi:hypothetical protein
MRNPCAVLVCLVPFLFTCAPRAASDGTEPVAPPALREITAAPWGPSESTIEAARARVAAHPRVTDVMRGGDHRLLSFELTESPAAAGAAAPPDGYRASFFDYARNRAYDVTGRFDSEEVQITPTDVQPEPNEDEFAAAVAIVAQDPDLGPPLRAGFLTAFEPMPPLADGDLPVGQTDRIVNVGLMPSTPESSAAVDSKGGADEIVGVNMIRRIVALPASMPATPRDPAADSPPSCGPRNASQSTTRRGTAGSFNVVIRRGDVELWNFVVVRPSASSGRRGSGAELRNVRYRGKSVFMRAHVPILNVQYQNNRCGPFRDWQWQEGAFAADGSDLAPGIRRTVTAPTTAVDTNVDSGNFRGVAVFDSGSEVVLATEMNAGWYRYVMKWILRDDGTIQPQFGFGAVRNRCVCNLHFHHAYWRFDFDVVDGARNSVCQAVGEGACTPVNTETRLAAVPGRLEIRNTAGTEGYSLIPGTGDGRPDAFSQASAWIVAFNQNEIDDGTNCTQGRNCQIPIDIDDFANGQNIANGNVVVWYRASFRHQEEGNSPPPNAASHIVGPELRPIGWTSPVVAGAR